jgi:predicted MPP superfamily phosphohydrolase
MGITRRQFIGATVGSGVVGAIGVGCYAWGYEPTNWEVTRTEIQLGDKPKLGQPVRVLHLSDLHASSSVSMEMLREAIELGLVTQPDVIFVTGDFFTGIFDQWDAYKKVLRLLSAVAPVYAVLGNHDGHIDTAGVGGWATRAQVTDLLADSGLKLLYNEHDRLTIRGQKIDLFGVGDLWRKECFPDRAFGARPARESADEPWRIALSHNPDSKDLFAPFDWDLMLCGHTHGGQVVLPVVGALWVPIEDKRFVGGLYAWENRQLFVTRGVGNLLGIRLNCRPEISGLELT